MGGGASTPDASAPRPDASAPKSNAPHLAEYFQKYQEKIKKSEDEVAQLCMDMFMKDDGEDMMELVEKKEAEITEWYEKVGKPILIKSFQHHDKDHSNALDAAEAKVFLLNLVQESETFASAMAQYAMEASLPTTLQMMKAMRGAKEAKKLEKEARREIDKIIAAKKKDYSKATLRYMKNKGAYDEEAFKLIDQTEDGRIELGEFLDMFLPGSGRMDSVTVALGFTTEQEKLQREQFKTVLREATAAAAAESPAAVVPIPGGGSSAAAPPLPSLPSSLPRKAVAAAAPETAAEAATPAALEDAAPEAA